MTRVFIISLTASLVALWVVTAKAEGWHGAGSYHPGSVAHSHAPQFPPAYAWPLTNREPAITKTLTPRQPELLQPEPNEDYQYEWQHQPAPPAPYLAAPQQFSYPQQGYFPRDGKVEQAPGYEYDFGGAGTYPPLVPMEGASWVASRLVKAKNGEVSLHAPQPFRHGSGFETHYGCLHW